MKYDLANEKLIQFFTDNPKATAKLAAEFYDDLISPEVEGIFERAFDFWLQSPFGILGRKVLGIEKKGAKEELTPEIARQYLNLAGGDRKIAEELAKDAGYEW